jgi:hypothetical protein
MEVIWGKREAEYFWGRGLDVTNQIDWVEEISFLAQRACGRKRCSSPHERSDMGETDSEGAGCRRVRQDYAR